MKRTLAALLLISLASIDLSLAQTVQPVQAPPSAAVFRARRERLMKQLGPGVAVLYSRAEETGDEVTHSTPDFYYLTGVDEEGAVLVLAPGERLNRQYLFLRSLDPDAERWTGVRPSLGDSLTRTLGFDVVTRASSLNASLVRLVEHNPILHQLAPPSSAEAARAPEAELYDKLQSRILGVSEKNQQRAIEHMRVVKDADELARMEKAIANTIAAQHAAARAIRPGVEENWIAGLIDLEYRRGGSTRAAFPSIVGSGPNSCILHYPGHDHTIAAGSLVVVDIGAEVDRYAADITRTYPADGRFSPEQRKIYELVLRVQNECIAMIKPGVYYEDVHRHAEEMFRAAGYRDAFLHYLGHGVGLEVHDVFDRGEPMKPGMVVTVEPGLYLANRGFGVRIEDEVLVTSNGHRLLTEKLPREVEAVERMMRESAEQAKR
jgi:Xaa-Pro aminopeptidase